jgi:immune inhibitor A
VEKFDRDHYLDLFFGTEGESFDDFYRELSSGRFRVTGDVSDWVQVPFNEASYGSNDLESTGYWAFIEDTAQAWYDAQLASGMTSDQIATYLAQFDVWDRYDHDGDGDFNEPDGYIDHFQAIHAGEGEEAGAEPWTIWSHRWYVNPYDIGRTGPEGNKLGGTPIGDTGLWIGDYTTEPENGGLGVFAHEFGHDLGLPDLYDTAGGENSTAFWTLMSAGSWLGHGEDPAVGGGVGIGTTPGHMGAWEKLQLGWLDYQYLPAGRSAKVTLGPASFTSRGRAKQALIVGLPDKQVSTSYNTPASGNYEWWSGSADNLNVTLTRPLDLTGATSASVSTAAWYDIEAGYDYLYAEVSTDGGSTWSGVGEPVDGSSEGQWTTLNYDVSAYAGSNVLFRFRYQTDGGVHYAGAFLDDIAVTVDGSTQVDDVEAGTGAWTADGWTRMTGTVSKTVTHYYIAENRQYTGYDEVLGQGPYNFGWPYSAPDLVEFFPYQDGLLVSYWDNEYEDNNTSQHPGHGLVLPVDARPVPIRFADGSLLGNRRQPFDATFGVQATDPVTFHREITVGKGRRSRIVELEAQVPSSPAIPQFDDSDPQAYWSADNPTASVVTAGQGISVTVTGQSGVDLSVRVDAR